MENINLLPWRQQRRDSQYRHVFFVGVTMLIVCLLIVFSVTFNFDEQVQYHKKRNAFLHNHIVLLDKKIKRIALLQEKQQTIIKEIESLHRLQYRRATMVSMMSDIVSGFPLDVYFNSIKKSDQYIVFEGVARSHDELAKLMRQYHLATQFNNPSLSIIRGKTEQGLKFNEFYISASINS